MTSCNCLSLCFCLCIGILAPLSIFGQKKSSNTTQTPKTPANVAPTAHIKLTSGEEFIAKILSKDSTSIQIMVVGTDELRRIELPTLVEIQAVKPNTTLMKEYDFSSRNAMSSTALSLKKGESYYQNTMLGNNSYYYGMTDRFTLGGGTVLFTLIEEAVLPVWAHVKYTYSFTPYLHVGGNILGLNAFELGDFGDNNAFLAAWGNLTIGDRYNNFTLGWGRQGEEFEGFFSNNMTQVSGQVRLGRRWTLVGDFWGFKPRTEPPINRFFPQDTRTHIYSAAVRHTFNRSTLEFGAMHCPRNRSFQTDEFTIPIVSYLRRW